MVSSGNENETEDEAGVERISRRLEHQSDLHRIAVRRYRKRRLEKAKHVNNGRSVRSRIKCDT